MKRISAALLGLAFGIIAFGIIAGCQQGSSATVPPPGSSKKVDVKIDTPGVKVDVKGQKKDPP